MKKLFSLALALAMCVSLAACGGGVDKQPAIDAHNAAGTAVNDLTTLINANPEPYADYLADMQSLVDQLNECGKYLEGDGDVTQEALDEWVKTCNDIEQWAKDAKAEIEAAPAPEPESEPAGDAPTAEQLAALTELYNQVAEAYNEAAVNADANGWMADEQTALEINTLAAVLEPVGEALSNGGGNLAGGDADAAIEQFQTLVPAMDELVARVSVPYEG